VSSPLSNLDDHLGYWLRMVSNAVSLAFARKVAGEGVTVAEWAFMRALFDSDGMAPSVLADRMGMTRGAITKLADRLVAKGLVSRLDSGHGHRGQVLSLTQDGRSKVPILAGLADSNDSEFFGVLSETERQDLGLILKALASRKGLSAVPVD
jgi:DNA-binding MarR family transcriptional regulator